MMDILLRVVLTLLLAVAVWGFASEWYHMK